MKILVIQQKMIGDVLASTLICEHLKKELENVEVHFLINEGTQAVVECNPYIDKIILFKKEHRSSKLALYHFLKNTRKNNYETVIDVLCKIESNLISFFSRAPKKISYKKWYSKFIYNHVFEYSKHENTQVGLAIENRLLLLRPILENLKNPLLEPKIYLSDDETKKAKALLINSGVPMEKPLIMVGILGSGPNKSYPLPYLAELLDGICETYDLTLLLNYMPAQKEKVQELLTLCNEKTVACIRDDVFGDSLRSFLGLLSQCHAYIGNEGGATNMAKALGVPNFSIFSPWISKKGWFTYPEKSENEAVHLSDVKPRILEVSKRERKMNADNYYKQFEPRYIESKLLDFIKREVVSHQ